MRPTLRSATALVASLSLLMPSITSPLIAQEAVEGDEAAIRAQARADCAANLGVSEGEGFETCLADAFAAAGLTAEAIEGAAEAATEAVEQDGVEEAAEEAVEAPEAVAEEVVESQAEEVPPVEEAAEIEATPEVVEEAAEEAIPEEVAPEIAEEAPVELPSEEAVAEELAEEVVVEEQAEIVEEEAAEATSPETAEAPDLSDQTEEAGAALEVQETEAEQPAVDGVDEPVAVETAAPGTALEESEIVEPMTRREARDICREREGRGNSDAIQACMVETLAANGQADLAERLADRFAARADGDVNAATESAVAEEIASQPEPELTEEEEVARQQTEAALAALEAEDDAAPAAAAAAADGEAEAVVVEETVTAEDVRSSSEDFQTSAVETDRDRDRGLSDTQKVVLGALGALAVGTILNNRTRVVSNSGDRVVVQRDDGDLQVLKDDDALLRQAGSNVRTQSFADGSTRSIVTREDGSQVITVRDASLRVLRRVLVRTDGTEVVLIDDTTQVAPVEVSELPTLRLTTRSGDGNDALREALRREAGLDRRFSLAQVRTIAEVRALAPAFEVDTVTFASGSAAIAPEQAGNLTGLAQEVLGAIRDNPRAVFLIEGHTDAVGDAAYNLALSDRRAETLALALNEYFAVPVENMVVQGYGERFLKVPTLEAERANRRATVRQITDLLQTAAAN